MNTAPKEIREHVARAKGYLRRDEIPRALDAMSCAVRGFASSNLFKQARFELTVQFNEFLLELNKHPHMQILLDPERSGKPRKITFQPGKEIILATVLEGLAKLLVNAAESVRLEVQNFEQQRKNELIETGIHHIQTGDIARGRAFLKRAAAEFGQELKILLEVGRAFYALEQFQDAAEIFESSMASFPKEAEAYAEAIESYVQALDFEKAEKVYLTIFRQFGGHPNTYGRLAKLYIAWNKPIKADEFAHRALQLDAGQAEALEVTKVLESMLI